MKKLMIAAVIAMVAMMSQAYSIKWGARNVMIPVADNVKVSQSGIVVTSGDKFAAGALTVQLYWVGSTGNNLIGEYKTTGDGVIAAQDFGGSSGVLYAAMIADSTTSYVPSYYYTATYTTADGTYTFSGSTSATKALSNINAANITATADFKNGSWVYTAASVPEPTSGLLLLLGMAGLALKRKRA